MKAKIIQEFKGEINGVVIVNETIYWTTEYIFSEIENLGIEVDDTQVVSEFVNAFERLYQKQNLDLTEFERELYSNIQEGYFIGNDYCEYRPEYFKNANKLLQELFDGRENR